MMMKSSNFHFLFRCASVGLRNSSYHTQRISFSIITKQLIIKPQHRMYFSSLCDLSSNKPDEDELHTSDVDEFEIDDIQTQDIDIDKITEGSPEKERKFKLLQLEVDVLRQQGEKVPLNMRTDRWIELMNHVTDKGSRVKYLRHLWLIEIKKAHRREKQIAHLKEFEEQKKILDEGKKKLVVTTAGPIIYSLTQNALFHRVYDGKIFKLYNYRLLMAEAYGPVLLIDCSYEPYMTNKNKATCAKQLLFMWSENREYYNPYHLIFCNMRDDSKILEKLNRTLRLIGTPDFPFCYTSKSYLDLYPKNKLVYLSPHAQDDILRYDSNDVYIIGAFVDQSQCEPVSLAKGKKEKLRLARFPLERYLKWIKGTKSLSINHSVGILNDLKDTGDWSYAFRHVPNRKVLRVEPSQNDPTENITAAKSVKEQFRRNLVYDLIMKENLKKKTTDSSGSQNT